MKRMPAVALSMLLAPPLAMGLSLAAMSSSHEMHPTCRTQSTNATSHSCCSKASAVGAALDDETYRKLQPGRLETAREIKDAADAFVLKGRQLSTRMNAQIAEAERLQKEAHKLQGEAAKLKAEQLILIAQQPAADNKPSTQTKTTSELPAPAAPGEKSAGTTGDASTTPPPGTPTNATVTPGAAQSGDAKSGDAEPGDGKPGDAKPGDAKGGDKDEKLTGRASTLQTNTMPNIPLIRLKGPQLQQAMRQYNIDVEQFKIHAADYNKHYNLFKSQIGECHAARAAFDELHKKYEMHCTAYHLNNIPPPRLCPPMAGSVAEANSIAGQLRSDQMRALRAEGQLRQEEGRLRELENMQGTADALVVKSGERDRREREIAGMFGRLRQEYDLLEIERRTIEHSKGGKPAAPIARPSVKGQIKKGK